MTATLPPASQLNEERFLFETADWEFLAAGAAPGRRSARTARYVPSSRSSSARFQAARFAPASYVL
jgi:hypothetical protein